MLKSTYLYTRVISTSRRLTPVCASLCVCACIRACIWVWVHMWVEARGPLWGSFSITYFVYVLMKGLSLNPKLADSVSLFSKPQGLCLCFPRNGIIGVYHHAWLFPVGSEDGNQVQSNTYWLSHLSRWLHCYWSSLRVGYITTKPLGWLILFT